LITINSAFSQQWVEFTQQHRYNQYVTPASVGLDNFLDAVVSHRTQYVGLADRAISTQFISVSAPIIDNKLGIGVRFVNDQIGYQNFLAPELALSYHLDIKYFKLSFGLSGGFTQIKLDGSQLRAVSGSYADGTIIHNDDNIPNIAVGGLAPTFSSGILANYKKFSFGIAMQNMNSPKVSFESNTNGTFIELNRTINIHSSYVIELDKLNIIPSTYYKTDFVKHQLLTTFMLDMRNIFLGMSFRGYSGFNNDAVAGIFGFKIKNKVSVGYSYDYNVSQINNSSSGSHEISIRYQNLLNFKEKKSGNIMHNPRFL
jgi:type IX secretion system PorP/SprF family membrane protein